MTARGEGDPSGFAETWATFSSLEHTLGRTDDAVETWRRGRAKYLVWTLRVREPAVLEKMAGVSARLGDAIVPVPPEDAHVTVWVCGFPTPTPSLDDDVAEAIVTAQRAAVAGVRAPRLWVGRPNAFATCAFLEVYDPQGDLVALRAALAVPGAKEVRFARYQPHVTVGRFSDTRPAAPLVAALAALRDEPRGPVPLRGRTLELVELDARAPDRLNTLWSAPR